MISRKVGGRLQITPLATRFRSGTSQYSIGLPFGSSAMGQAGPIEHTPSHLLVSVKWSHQHASSVESGNVRLRLIPFPAVE
jgi:hypothetical protein